MTDRAKVLAAVTSTLIGLACLLSGGYLLLTEPRITDAAAIAAHKLHYEIAIGLAGLGLLLVVPGQLASGISKVGSAALPYTPWGRAGGAAPPLVSPLPPVPSSPPAPPGPPL